MRIVPIVEGHGEVEAVPILLRRILHNRGMYQIKIAKPIRIPRTKMIRQKELARAVELAARQPDCAVILIILDADDDCPKELAPRLLNWARETRRDIPSRVIIAKSEFESWFIGSIESLRNCTGIQIDAVCPTHPEEIRDAKEWLNMHMPRSRPYTETIDQPAFAARFDLMRARVSCPSFDKFMRDINAIITLLIKK